MSKPSPWGQQWILPVEDPRMKQSARNMYDHIRPIYQEFLNIEDTILAHGQPVGWSW